MRQMSHRQSLYVFRWICAWVTPELSSVLMLNYKHALYVYTPKYSHESKVKVKITPLHTVRCTKGKYKCSCTHASPRREVGWVITNPWPLYSRERAPVPIVGEAGWVPWPVLTGAGKRKSLEPTTVRTPNRRASSESLYRLSYMWH
jgi:hypothetical protein